jgi:hypothetical protein
VWPDERAVRCLRRHLLARGEAPPCAIDAGHASMSAQRVCAAAGAVKVTGTVTQRHIPQI